jgi:hypothetical protein
LVLIQSSKVIQKHLKLDLENQIRKENFFSFPLPPSGLSGPASSPFPSSLFSWAGPVRRLGNRCRAPLPLPLTTGDEDILHYYPLAKTQ